MSFSDDGGVGVSSSMCIVLRTGEVERSARLRGGRSGVEVFLFALAAVVRLVAGKAEAGLSTDPLGAVLGGAVSEAVVVVVAALPLPQLLLTLHQTPRG